MSPNLLNCFDTVSPTETQKKKTVEGQLWNAYKALAEQEGNVYLLSNLKKMGLATNDVWNFVEKQSLHKRVNCSMDTKVMASAMRSKLVDACAFVKRLRQLKNTLRNRVTRKYHHSKSKGKRIIDDMVKRYKKLRHEEYIHADKKIGLQKDKFELALWTCA